MWVVSEAEDGATSSFCTPATLCWGSDVSLVTLAAPAITSLNAAYGPGVGGQTVTVDGTDFGEHTTATFNGSPITIGNLTPTSFTLVTPPSGSTATTTVQVQATDPAGSSVEDAASLYTYLGLSNYTTVPPFRILDTRTGTCVQCSTNPTFGPGVTEKLQLTGVTGLSVTDPIPSTATAVVLNVTEVAGTASSLLTVYPFGPGEAERLQPELPAGQGHLQPGHRDPGHRGRGEHLQRARQRECPGRCRGIFHASAAERLPGTVPSDHAGPGLRHAQIAVKATSPSGPGQVDRGDGRHHGRDPR